MATIGRTQLVKLVYLGDLAFAATHNGQTFTGLDWRFLHFGPWAPELERIPAVAASVGAAVVRRLHSDTETEHEGWDGTHVALSAEVRKAVPVDFKVAVERSVRTFRGDTAALLDHVYRTQPMLSASPRGRLDFGTAVRRPLAPTAEPVSAKQQKKRDEVGRRLGARIAEARRLGAPGAQAASRPVVTYDEDYAAVESALSEGEAPLAFRGVLRFTDEFWSTGWRGADEGDEGDGSD
jgi:hypothetical protein